MNNGKSLIIKVGIPIMIALVTTVLALTWGNTEAKVNNNIDKIQTLETRYYSVEGDIKVLRADVSWLRQYFERNGIRVMK